MMPLAMPALQKLCLSHCFESGGEEVSPNELKTFFRALNLPLTSLTICQPFWLKDEHVEAVISLLGNLTRLELVECTARDESVPDEYYDNDEHDIKLSDSSMTCIAEHCNSLESFAMVNTSMSSYGLEKVLKANPNITTLNLSSSRSLDARTVEIIPRCLPNLGTLRSYWPGVNMPSYWLNDNSLISLVDALEKSSSGSLPLKRIGFQSEHYVTSKGVAHAVKKGVKEIEIDAPHDELFKALITMKIEAKFYHSHYIHYIDGSKNEDNIVSRITIDYMD